MAFQSFPGGMLVPQPLAMSSTGMPTFSGTLQIDSSAEKVALIIEVPRTGTLDKFEFRTSTVAAGPDNGLRCSFQDVDATTGNPDGSVDQYRVVTVADADDNTWIVPGLITSDGTDTGTKRNVTRGEMLACVIDFGAAYVDGNVQISGFTIDPTASTIHRQYATLFTTAWAKQTAFAPILALKYDDGTYAPLGEHVYPVSSLPTVNFSSASTPDERALYFSFPFPVKVGGAWFRVDPLTSNNAFDVVLYDSDGSTVLATKTIDGDVMTAATGRNSLATFDSEVELDANTNYRLAIKPGASNVHFGDLVVPSAAIMDAMVGGAEFHYSSRADAGSWTQDTTRRPIMGLIVTAFDDAVGGGGGGTGGGPLVGGRLAR